jgi:hypothetical protein
VFFKRPAAGTAVLRLHVFAVAAEAALLELGVSRMPSKSSALRSVLPVLAFGGPNSIAANFAPRSLARQAVAVLVRGFAAVATRSGCLPLGRRVE